MCTCLSDRFHYKAPTICCYGGELLCVPVPAFGFGALIVWGCDRASSAGNFVVSVECRGGECWEEFVAMLIVSTCGDTVVA